MLNCKCKNGDKFFEETTVLADSGASANFATFLIKNYWEKRQDSNLQLSFNSPIPNCSSIQAFAKIYDDIATTRIVEIIRVLSNWTTFPVENGGIRTHNLVIIIDVIPTAFVAKIMKKSYSFCHCCGDKLWYFLGVFDKNQISV